MRRRALVAGLPAVALLGACLVAAGCDEPRAATPPLKRSEVVAATGPTGAVARPPAATAAAGTAAAKAHPAAPRRPRAICAGPPLHRALPAGHLAQARAAGAAALDDRLVPASGSGGAWTWVSLWAAWCKPCVEEIPRLLRWQTRLGGALRVRFLSLDDDRRQLQRMLDGQPRDGMRASYWLTEGRARDAWLTALGLKTEPTLPVQLLLDPKGQVHCVIEGAVEEGDFDRVAAIVKRR